MCKGKLLDLKKTAIELNLSTKEKLIAVGSLSEKILTLSFFAGPPRYFHRFYEVQNAGWIVGRRTGGSNDRWDAVTFVPRRDVKIVGVGIFEDYPAQRRDFKYYHKYVLQEPGGAQIMASETFEEQVVCPPAEEIVDHIFKYRF